jgi:hypothetical protein
MSYDKLILALTVIIAISMVICIIKKVTKIIIFVLVVAFAFSFVKSIQSGKSPTEVFNSSKNDITYAEQIYNYTPKIKKSVDNTIADMESQSIPNIIVENKNLHTYLDKISILPHGIELNIFHDKYLEYLKNIVFTSDTIVKAANASNGVVNNADEVKNNLNKYLNQLTQIKLK